MPANWSLTATPIGTFPAGLPPVTVTGATLVTATRSMSDRAWTTAHRDRAPSGYILEHPAAMCDPVEPRVDVINLAPLDIGVCTFTNNDTPASLTLVKTVTNDNGGTAGPTAWTLSAGRPDADHRVRSGSRSPTRRQRRDVHAVGVRRTGRLHGGHVDLHRGHRDREHRGRCRSAANVTCTINNNDQPARLTLVKTVTNDNGGTAPPTAWTLAAAGPTTDLRRHRLGRGDQRRRSTPAPTHCPSPAARRLRRRRLVLHRRHPDRLQPGARARGERNLHDQQQRPAGTLTLVKTVTNDNGGTAEPTAWTLAAGRPDPDLRDHRDRPPSPTRRSTPARTRCPRPAARRLHRRRLVLHGAAR